ncbi:MAG: tetratricopeptide 2 repeat protein [Lacrimispora sp.]|jgi:hypothetical protein|nr:tetratricopeptide 2 repeat protein [Lacrimispora sp.]
MKLEKWILEELEDMPVDVLADSVENGLFKSLQINDGHIIGCEKAETPGAATPRESR